MRKLILFFLILFLLNITIGKRIYAQDSSHISVSLITCTPGEELYSIFGHSAIRVVDSISMTDYMFNFGTFNFDDDGFYLKFMRGQLMYYLSVERTSDFIYNYMALNRGITEQILMLSPAEKINIKNTLINNAKEENKYYKYDFFLDNCTTRLRDIIKNSKNPQPELPAVMPESTTFRDAIHEYLEKGGQLWSELGIDILLGMRTDKIMSASEQEFLPDNLLKATDSCQNTILVKKKNKLYTQEIKPNIHQTLTPDKLFWLLFVFIFTLGFFKYKAAEKILFIFDCFFYSILGMLGLILVLMWVATDHSMTKDNFNLLWAFPLHVLLPFTINKNSDFARLYLLFTFLFSLFTLAVWFFLPQELNNSLLPVVLTISIRSGSRYFDLKKSNHDLQ